MTNQNEVPTKSVTVKTVTKESVDKIFEYLNTKPYGDVAEIMLTVNNLYAAYKNNTEIIVNLQPDLRGRVELDDN